MLIHFTLLGWSSACHLAAPFELCATCRMKPRATVQEKPYPHYFGVTCGTSKKTCDKTNPLSLFCPELEVVAELCPGIHAPFELRFVLLVVA